MGTMAGPTLAKNLVYIEELRKTRKLHDKLITLPYASTYSPKNMEAYNIFYVNKCTQRKYSAVCLIRKRVCRQIDRTK